ncbi:MAG: DUF373 family protein [Candidatus Methanoliparum thermophilum]|uniref:DUF373 family protein n=1 Tax=Methanoliparum thermophilum TaxID=2491083 RepID=A0A520KR82_METT2|nr:DUF373 family protein [Candidatus Methanoliparum sp. LAM-1]RZN64135.1 MAG: DUF373 family protein [Candidatus Methanoliparum thermophilum]BDC35601.1 hypothetical protein MTLP_02830 [Candidatus Methanoliparum sp. LAM-1]
MSVAILCIDRDDDIGIKAGFKTPVIGRENNLILAERLGLADPEESDLNALYGAIKIYDELVNDEKDVILITIAGDQDVGYKSDKKIKDQLDSILKEYDIESVILVSDGIEDEFILPIIESRVKIDYIKRIIVKQAKNIESAYYILKKLFMDPKITKRVFVPIALILLVYGISLLFGRQELAFGGVICVLAIYILSINYGWSVYFESFWKSISDSFIEGRVPFVIYVLGIILFFMGLIQGAISTIDISGSTLLIVMMFISSSIWWFVVGAIFLIIGSILDYYFKEGKFGRKLVFPFFALAIGIILWGMSRYIILLENYGSYTQPTALKILIISIIGCLLVSILGIKLSFWLENKNIIK